MRLERAHIFRCLPHQTVVPLLGLQLEPDQLVGFRVDAEEIDNRSIRDFCLPTENSQVVPLCIRQDAPIQPEESGKFLLVFEILIISLNNKVD